MSIAPRNLDTNIVKHCFVYCGDDFCDCQRGAVARANRNTKVIINPAESWPFPTKETQDPPTEQKKEPYQPWPFPTPTNPNPDVAEQSQLDPYEEGKKVL